MMNYRLEIVTILAVIFLWGSCWAVSKYSEDANAVPSAKIDAEKEPVPDLPRSKVDGAGKKQRKTPVNPEKPFRGQAFNLIWEKASKRPLSESVRKELFVGLSRLDEEYMLQKYAADHGEEPASTGQSIDQKIEALLESLHLDDLILGLRGYVNGNAKHPNIVVHQERPQTPNGLTVAPASLVHPTPELPFSDPKLHKLWFSAVQSQQFTEEDLSALQEEFVTHQEYIDRYSELLEQERLEEAEMNRVYQNQKQMKSDKLKLMQKELKLKMKGLKDKVKRGVVGGGVVGGAKEGGQLFSKDQVQQLWALAQNQTWSDDERQLLQVELTKFEQKLLKLEYLKQRAAEQEYEELHAVKVKKAEKPLKKHVHDSMQKQFKDHERRVAKMEQYLASKIKHGEL